MTGEGTGSPIMTSAGPQFPHLQNGPGSLSVRQAELSTEGLRQKVDKPARPLHPWTCSHCLPQNGLPAPNYQDGTEPGTGDSETSKPRSPSVQSQGWGVGPGQEPLGLEREGLPPPWAGISVA